MVWLHHSPIPVGRRGVPALEAPWGSGRGTLYTGISCELVLSIGELDSFICRLSYRQSTSCAQETWGWSGQPTPTSTGSLLRSLSSHNQKGTTPRNFHPKDKKENAAVLRIKGILGRIVKPKTVYCNKQNDSIRQVIKAFLTPQTVLSKS